MTYDSLFRDFLNSRDTLRVYAGEKPVFTSEKERLLPLMEYIETSRKSDPQAVIFDKITGKAAALLSVKAGCREIYSPLGSQLAINALNRYGIGYHFEETVPYIIRSDGQDMCPMEAMSLDKDPEGFYQAMKNIIGQPKADSAGD